MTARHPHYPDHTLRLLVLWGLLLTVPFVVLGVLAG